MPGQRNRVMILAGSIFLAVGLVLGTVFVLIGSQDYSSYTARAEATVVEVDVDVSRNSSGERTTTTSYDIEFVADGRPVRITDIGGVRYGDYAAVGYATESAVRYKCPQLPSSDRGEPAHRDPAGGATGRRHRVITVQVDSGMKYLGGDLYKT